MGFRVSAPVKHLGFWVGFKVFAPVKNLGFWVFGMFWWVLGIWVFAKFGFMPGKSATDAIFGLRILGEKYREGQKELHCVFIDLEKAYDTVPRDEVWYCLRSAGVAETYIRVIQDMYDGSETIVRCAVGTTQAFGVKVGLHQGSALSPFLFAVVMDQLTTEVRRDTPWTMMFADDIG